MRLLSERAGLWRTLLVTTTTAVAVSCSAGSDDSDGNFVPPYRGPTQSNGSLQPNPSESADGSGTPNTANGSAVASSGQQSGSIDGSGSQAEGQQPPAQRLGLSRR